MSGEVFYGLTDGPTADKKRGKNLILGSPFFFCLVLCILFSALLRDTMPRKVIDHLGQTDIGNYLLVLDKVFKISTNKACLVICLRIEK